MTDDTYFPQSRRAFTSWWKRNRLPMVLGDDPDATQDDIDHEWLAHVAALCDEGDLPEAARYWTPPRVRFTASERSEVYRLCSDGVRGRFVDVRRCKQLMRISPDEYGRISDRARGVAHAQMNPLSRKDP